MIAFLYVALCSLLDRDSHSRRKEHAALIFKGIHDFTLKREAACSYKTSVTIY
jgi:hypothetical protein